MERITQRLEHLFVRADHALNGVLSLLVRSVLAYDRYDGPTQARSIAYFALFSIFPLLLILIVVAGSMLDSEEAQRVVTELVDRFVPVLTDLVATNIESLLSARTTVGIVALVALFWSASGVFVATYRAVNMIWGNAKSTLFWSEKLFGLAVTLTIGALLLGTIVLRTVMSIVRSWHLVLFDWQPVAQLSSGWQSEMLTVVVPVGAFIVLYRIIPRAQATWRDVWLGGLIAGLAWVAITWLFGWVLGGVVRSNPIYGSVGGIAAFLLWSYWSALVLLMGAGFTAEYARWRRAGRPLETRRLREWMVNWPE